MTTVRRQRGVFKWKLGDVPHTAHLLQSPTAKKFLHNWKIMYWNGAILLHFEQGVGETAVLVRYPKNPCMINILLCDVPYRGHLIKVITNYPTIREYKFH